MIELSDLSQMCFDHACEVLRDENGVHCETLVALFAGLTGAQLFANEAGATGDAWELAPGTVTDLDGVPEAVDELYGLIKQVVEGHLSREPKVASLVPPNHAPHEGFGELVADHHLAFNELLNKHNVDAEERPFLFAVVAAQTIITVERAVPIPVALRLCDDGMRHCARTRPIETRRQLLS